MYLHINKNISKKIFYLFVILLEKILKPTMALKDINGSKVNLHCLTAVGSHSESFTVEHGLIANKVLLMQQMNFS